MATRYRPARTLVVLAATIAGLFVLMTALGIWVPRLGLDLRGGTTITLTASNIEGGGSVDSGSLDEARNIIEQRVNGLGVGESEVATSGGNQIVVSVPGVQQDELVELVGQTAVLTFRPVLASGAAPPSDPTAEEGEEQVQLPTAPPAPDDAAELPVPEGAAIDYQPTPADQESYAAFVCSDDTEESRDRPMVACDETGALKYLLGPTLIDGDRLSDANAVIPPGRFDWIVQLEFDGEGAGLFEDATGQLAQRPQPEIGGSASPTNQFAVVLDGDVVTAPTVTSAIPGGRAEITGQFTQESSQALASVLRYGALPLAFDVSSVDNVSATLGGEQLEAGFIAGIIGLALVIAFSVTVYRGLGLVVIASLAVAGVLTYQFLVLLGEAAGLALNLPGIAGAIIAIGMTADSFVLYFERIREEMRLGRSMRSAVEYAWAATRRTILISDAVQLLSAVVLFGLAIGSVRGFAFMLGLTTLIDLFIVFFFTKPVMSLLARTKFFGTGRRGSGLEPEQIGGARRRPVTPVKAAADRLVGAGRGA